MKFLVDAMLGKLTRFLRIFGFDTVYANDLEEHFKISPVPDEKLVIYAQKNNRIIITKDYPLYKSFTERGFYLKGEGIYNYLHQLKNNLNLNLNFSMENARCSICNSSLKKITDKKLIEDRVKSETYKHYDEFFQCLNPNCKKVYWDGPHIMSIIKKLKANSLLT